MKESWVVNSLTSTVQMTYGENQAKLTTNADNIYFIWLTINNCLTMTRDGSKCTNDINNNNNNGIYIALIHRYSKCFTM